MRPSTQPEMIEQVREWLTVKRKRRNVSLNSESLERSLYVFLIEGIPEAFCSDATGMEFVRTVTAAMADAPASYFSHGLKSYVIPFAWWLGIVDTETMMKWKEMIPNYRATVSIADRTPSTEDVVSTFSMMRSQHNANDFYSCLYDAIAATLLVTGCRRRQIISLIAGQDVTLQIKESGDMATFGFVPYKDYTHRHHMVTVPVSMPLPGGGTYGDYLYDWIEMRPRLGERFFCKPNGNPVAVQTLYNRIREKFFAATGTAYTPHALRSFTVSLIANTQSLEHAQHFVGHRTMATTMKYHNPYANGNRTVDIISGAMAHIGETPNVP